MEDCSHNFIPANSIPAFCWTHDAHFSVSISHARHTVDFKVWQERRPLTVRLRVRSSILAPEQCKRGYLK